MTLGSIIKNFRKEHGNMSMDEFSKLSGISKGYVSMLEKNSNPNNGKPIAPSVKVIRQISAAIGIDFNTLVEMLDDEHKISILDSCDTTHTVKDVENFEHSIMEFDKISIGERIRNLRSIDNLTLEEVGQKIGVTKQTLYKYEMGIISNIPSDKIEQLANLFECSPAELMGWENSYSQVKINSGAVSVSEPSYPYEIETIAAHHDGKTWTEEELEEIERFKAFVISKRQEKG